MITTATASPAGAPIPNEPHTFSNLAQARRALRVSDYELARTAGVPVATVRAAELGRAIQHDAAMGIVWACRFLAQQAGATATVRATDDRDERGMAVA